VEKAQLFQKAEEEVFFSCVR